MDNIIKDLNALLKDYEEAYPEDYRMFLGLYSGLEAIVNKYSNNQF